ncbi:MAG: addiction module protein [Chthoniobacterales bacterium]
MTAAEVKAMPVGQKFIIMETLWQDLQDHFEAMPVPDEVKNLLDERRARVARGEAAILDWDEVKSALGRG